MPITYPAWLTWGFKPETKPDGEPLDDEPPTVLPDVSEFRARLETGNLFFRSKVGGTQANDLWVQLDVGASGTGPSGLNSFPLTLTVGLGDTILETFTAEQKANPPDADHPKTAWFSPHGPTALRQAVNGTSQFIELPERGTDYIDALGTDPTTGRTLGRDTPAPTEDEYLFLTPIPRTSLAGGDGLPRNAVGLRAGMFHALVFLRFSERFSADGRSGDANTFLVWVGATADDPAGYWRAYDDTVGGTPGRDPSPYDTNLPWATVAAAFPPTA